MLSDDAAGQSPELPDRAHFLAQLRYCAYEGIDHEAMLIAVMSVRGLEQGLRSKLSPETRLFAFTPSVLAVLRPTESGKENLFGEESKAIRDTIQELQGRRGVTAFTGHSRGIFPVDAATTDLVLQEEEEELLAAAAGAAEEYRRRTRNAGRDGT
jgi:hypothetical protein